MASFRPVCGHFITGTCRFGAACTKSHVSSETIGQMMQQINQLQEDYGKLVEAPELADVVLLVEGERFPAHRVILAARSEYFRGLLLSGMQEGSGQQQEIELGEVSARAFRVVLRHLYTAEVPAWGEVEGAGNDAGGGGGAVEALPGGLRGRPDGAHGHRAPGVGAHARARGGARVGDGARGAAHQDHSGD